jgi:hypothetical protein
MITIFRQILIAPGAGTGQSSSKKRLSARRTHTLVACYILVGAAAAMGVGHVSHAHTTLPRAAAAAQDSQEHPTPDIGTAPPLTGKQKQDILKSNFEKLKRDADELAALAKSLQEEIDKSNENVLSLKVMEKAEKIERLAKKIKAVAKGE